MTWATLHIQHLMEGQNVQFRPRGHSMAPRVKNGQLCYVSPCTVKNVVIGDVVLCHVGGFDYLHLVKAIQGNRVLIGNNRGRINGWTTQVYGKLVKLEE